MESVNLSFLRRTLHTAHDRIHMLLLPQFPYKIGLSDRGFGCRGLSFDCQTNVLRMSRTQGSVTNSSFRESTPTCTSVSPHLYCAACSKTVSEEFRDWRRNANGLMQFWAFANERLGCELAQDDVHDIWECIDLRSLKSGQGVVVHCIGAEVEPELSWGLSYGGWDTDFLKSSDI
jgi:hypothetical protein